MAPFGTQHPGGDDAQETERQKDDRQLEGDAEGQQGLDDQRDVGLELEGPDGDAHPVVDLEEGPDRQGERGLVGEPDAAEEEQGSEEQRGAYRAPLARGEPGEDELREEEEQERKAQQQPAPEHDPEEDGKADPQLLAADQCVRVVAREGQGPQQDVEHARGQWRDGQRGREPGRQTAHNADPQVVQMLQQSAGRVVPAARRSGGRAHESGASPGVAGGCRGTADADPPPAVLAGGADSRALSSSRSAAATCSRNCSAAWFIREIQRPRFRARPGSRRGPYTTMATRKSKSHSPGPTESRSRASGIGEPPCKGRPATRRGRTRRGGSGARRPRPCPGRPDAPRRSCATGCGRRRCRG